MLILVTTATTGGGVLFQAGAPFSIKNAKFWPVLAIFGYFVKFTHFLIVDNDGDDSDDGNSDDVELPWNHVDHPWGEASLLYKLSNCQTTEMLSTRSLIFLDHDLLTIHSIENIITPSSQIIFAIFLTSVASAQPAS